MLLFSQEIPIAVHFAYEDDQLSQVYQHISTAVTSDKAGTAFEGSQFVCNTVEPQ